jgi:hypothetical protein
VPSDGIIRKLLLVVVGVACAEIICGLLFSTKYATMTNAKIASMIQVGRLTIGLTSGTAD